MKFNTEANEKNVTTNYEGAKAYSLSPELELYTAVVTCLVDDNYYEGRPDRVKRIRQLIQTCPHEFTAKLAVYARTQMNLRSIPIVLAAELAKIHSGDDLVAKTVNGVIQRADEITELLAYYQTANNRTGEKKLNKLSKQLQKGLQAAFNKFDKYQFAKYNRKTEVKFRDALFLVHPKAKDAEQQLIFDKIAKETLETPYTWETELSRLGQQKFESETAKFNALRDKWEELIDSGKLGDMALLRNLANILYAKVSYKQIDKVCATLSNPVTVRNAKQFPFRFLSAYREISKLKSYYGLTGQVMNTLEKAVVVSAEHINGFDEKTSVVIACDVSGSMQKEISRNSTVQNYDIGLLLGMLLKSRCQNVISGIFGNTWKIVNLPNTGVLSNVEAFYKREGEVGYATNGHLVIQDLIDHNVQADKVMMFTDCQLWNTLQMGVSFSEVWKQYKNKFPAAKLYLFNLNGYGKTPVNSVEKDVYLISGWSDRIFDMLTALESGGNAVQEIEKMVL
jgi:hypothetical protein